MARTLTLIRHTAPDVAPGLCYGQLDVGLAASFPQEAAQALHYLPRAELIFTSPLARAARLAEYLAQARQTELRQDARLMEMHFGAWEGRAWHSIARAELDAWGADLMDYAPPGGECARQLMRRTEALLRELPHLPHRHIAIVAHAGVVRALLAQLAGIPLAEALSWDLPHGAVLCVRI